MGCELTSAEEIQMEQESLSSSVLDLTPAGYYQLSYMPATQPHEDSGVQNPAAA